MELVIAIAAALALFIGLALGLLGGGGSILTLPILRYVLGMEAHDAIAVSLLVVGTTSTAAMIPHARRGRVRWRTGIVFGLAGMVGAFGAGRVAHYIPSSVLLGLFGLMMMVTALAMMRGRKVAPASASGPAPATDAPPARASDGDLPIAKVLGEGLVVGAVTGLVGAGGGFLVVPALVLLGGLSMEVAVGTSLVVIAMKSFAGFAGYLGHAHIDWTIAGVVSASAVVGSLGGGALASKVSPDGLRKGFAWFVVAMAFFILGQEIPRALDVEPPMVWVLAGTALGVALVAGLAQLLRHFGRAGRDEPTASATVGHGPT
ncbi:MAG: sulfite exporter TauE/SafE family protein [Deltaproteobacteria bacterium]|nr:sulfite exporter TauE/SafE family protein [Deltaproteobacteria bacterium]